MISLSSGMVMYSGSLYDQVNRKRSAEMRCTSGGQSHTVSAGKKQITEG